MTKLGQELIARLEEKLSQAKPSAPQSSSAFQKLLESYFQNIVWLPPEDPKQSEIYQEVKRVTRPPNETAIESFGAAEELRDSPPDFNQAVLFSVDKSEESKNVILDTPEKWKKFHAQEMQRVQERAKNEFAAAKQEFDDFIEQCTQPENSSNLLSIIKTIEDISNTNKQLLLQIGEAYQNMDTRISLALLKNDQYAEEMFNWAAALAENPQDLELAATFIVYITPILAAYDEEEYEDYENQKIQAAIAPFENINPVSQMIKVQLAAKAKHSPFINNFLKQISNKKFDDHLKEFLAFGKETLKEEIDTKSSHPKMKI